MSGLIEMPANDFDISTAYAAAVQVVEDEFAVSWATPNYTKLCIVGGFYRDLFTGRQWKDVDVFIPGDRPMGDAEELEYDLSRNYEREYNGVVVNMIHLQGRHTLETLLTRCDVGICQIGAYFDRPDRVFCTQEFLDDLTNKTLTVTRRTRWNHLERVIDKFPDHEVIDPYQNHTGSRRFS